MSNSCVVRIQRDLRELSTNPLPQIYVAPHDDDISHVQALILGPPGTPYAYGFFRFDMRFPHDYPNTAPTVHITTTDGGKVRFNPNLYSCGKVCLSILGTWQGESGEQWSSVQSVSSVLLSIQSLMCEKPYHNEPGFEARGTGKEVEEYNAKIMHETLRVSVCAQLEEILRHTDLGAAPGASPEPQPSPRGASSSSPAPANGAEASSSSSPSPPPGGAAGKAPRNDYYGWEYREWNPFADIMKREFLLRHDTYMGIVEKERERAKDGTSFKKAPFECPGNGMFGSFDYAALVNRLKSIKERLLLETRRWELKGVEHTRNEIYATSRLKVEMDKLKREPVAGISCGPSSESNLYAWEASVLGPEDTPWEGGFFTLRMTFSDRYPDDPPRLQFAPSCKLFHPNITSDGVPYYSGPTFRETEAATSSSSSATPGAGGNAAKRLRAVGKGGDSIADILGGVMDLFTKPPLLSAVCVLNQEAADLYLKDRAAYNKRVRRCVQASMEG